MPMLDQRPYLLRALNDWIVDPGFPHVLVDATMGCSALQF